MLSYISTSVSDYLSEKELCRDEICQVGDLTVYCGHEDTECIEEEADQEMFYAAFNITMTNR